jgi:serine/threonine protein phosphatase PrpC
MYKPIEIFKKNTDPTTLWEVGCTAQQGHRPSMEDEHIVDMWFNNNGCPCLLAGVFDGHFGSQCSKYLVGSMPGQLKELLNDTQPSSVVGSLHSTFISTDKSVQNFFVLLTLTENF